MISDLSLVSGTLQTLLERGGKPICYDCKGARQMLTYAPDGAAAPTGLLPGFLAAADAVWREATGRSLGLEITADRRGVLGFRVEAIHSAPFSIVMLCVMEVLDRIDRPDILLANDLVSIWRAALLRATPARAPASTA